MAPTGRLTIALLVAAASGLALAGCSSTEKRELETAPQAPIAPAQAAAAPAPGGGQGALLAQAGPGLPVGPSVPQVGRRPRPGAPRGSVRDQESRVLADSYYQSGLNAYNQMRYHEAAQQLRQAVKVDPNLAPAQLLLDQTLYILGDRVAGFRDEMRRISDETSVRIQLTSSEVERLFAEGQRYMDRHEYAQASERFDRCLETIRYFPFNVDQSGLKRRTEEALKLSRQKEKERDVELKRQRQVTAREHAAILEQRNVAYHHARVRTLLGKAVTAFQRTDYKLAGKLAGYVLDMDPNNKRALKLIERSDTALRFKLELESIGTRIEEMKRLIEGVYEAAIPYQDIFQFPPDDEWALVEKRALDLERLFETKGREESAEELRIRRTLENSKITINFPGTAFQDAMDFVRDVTGINFVVTHEAQDEIDGAEPEINLKLKDITLKNALDLILAEAGGLIYRIRNDAVVINTADGETAELYLRFYEVSDIIGSPPDFPGPHLALKPPTEEGDGGGAGVMLDIGGDEEDIGTGFEADKLIELIEQKLGESEEEVDVQFMGGLLMVRAPLEAHKKIDRLLDQLRRTTGVLVTIDTQIIDIQDNLLEEIGVDFAGLPALIPNAIAAGVNNFTNLIGFDWTNSDGSTDIRSSLVNIFSQSLGSAAGAPFNLTSLGGGGFQYNVLDSFQLQALIDAVKRKQRSRLVDSSRITVFNGQRSHVLAVTQEAYIADIEVNQTGVTPTINPVIGLLNSGSILEARPIVSYDRKFVTLEIQPTIAINGTPVFQRLQLIQGQGGTNTDVTIQLPVVSLTEIRTTVMVPDGGTVIIGGLKNFLNQEQVASVPIIRNVPVLHNFFERQGYTDLKRSLIVLLSVDITIVREEEAKSFNRQGSVQILD